MEKPKKSQDDNQQRQNPVPGEPEKEASRVVDEMRLGGVNISKLARQGLQEKLCETLSDSAAKILIGDSLEEIERERQAFEEAFDLDTSGVFQS